MPLPPLSWMVGVFNKDFAFHALAMDDPALKPEWASAFPAIESGANIFWGYVWKDGELTPLIAARKLTKRADDGLTPVRIEMELDDAKGRTFPIVGDMQASMPAGRPAEHEHLLCQTRWEYSNGEGKEVAMATRRTCSSTSSRNASPDD